MKASFPAICTLPLLVLLSSAFAADPTPCSVAVEVVTRTGAYRTWTNALETNALNLKGLDVCQDDALLGLSVEEGAELSEAQLAKLLRCKTEFKLELFYREDMRTRNITIFRGDLPVYSQDYPDGPPSQRILKALPNCATLQANAKKLAN